MANSLTVGALRVLLSADTAQFEKALAGADASTKKLANTMKRDLAPSQDKINSLIRQFAGTKEIGNAEAYAKAIGDVSNASKLTAQHQQRTNEVMQKALAHYKALGQEAPPHIVALEQATRRASDNSVVSFTKVKEAALGYIAGLATIQTAQLLWQKFAAFLGDSVSEFLEADKIQRQLEASLRAQGTAIPAVIEHFEALANKYKKLTVNSDEAIKETQALLVQVGGVLPSEMDKALSAVTNLAAGLGIDLRAATMMVAKSFEDNFGALKKAGISLDEAKAKAEGMDYVLGQIQARFDGQAKAEIESYAGQIKQLENNWSDFKEELGRTLVTSGTMGDALKVMQVGVTLLTIELAHFSTRMKNFPTIGKLFENPIGAFSEAEKQTQADMRAMLDRMAKAKRDADTGIKGNVEVAAAEKGIVAARELSDKEAKLAKLREENSKQYANQAKQAEARYQSWKKSVVGLSDAERELLNHMLRLAKEGGPQLVGSLLKIDTAIESIIDKQMGSKLAASIMKAGDAARLAADKITALQRATELKVTPTSWSALFSGAIPGSQLAAGVKERSLAIADLAQFNKHLNTASSLIGMVGMQAQGEFRRIMRVVGLASNSVFDLAYAFKAAKGNLDAFANSAAAMNAGMSFASFGITAVIDDINRSMAEADAARQKQIANLKQLREEFGLTAEQVKAIQRQNFDAAGGGFSGLGRGQTDLLLERLRKAKDAIDNLSSAAEAFGGVVPRSLHPMVQELLKIQNLPASFRAQLEALASAPSWQKIEERAEALGIDKGGLGTGFNQAKVKDLALGFVRDITMFADAGADADTVLRGMSDELSNLLIEAQKTGAALPKTLEPYLKRLSEMGLLVDANGNAIDMGALSFREFEDEALTAMKDLLTEIKDILAKAFPAAADAAGRAIDKLAGSFRGLVGARPQPMPVDGATSPWMPPDLSSTASLSPDIAASYDGSVGLSSQQQTSTFIFNFDERALARSTISFIPGETKRLGLNRV